MADGALQRQMRKEVELQLLCHENQNIVKLVSMFQVALFNCVLFTRALNKDLPHVTFHM